MIIQYFNLMTEKLQSIR